MNPVFPRSALGLAVLSLLALAGARDAAAQSASDADAAPSLQEVTITGNPLGASERVTPAASYAGPSLLLRSKSTLGETLDGTPGVASSYFGPNASRPVIRGLAGDRIRVLQNGGASVDASGLSDDHAVAQDPLTVERIEVLRGPAALLYGGSAIGGVVNVIDNRIPREPVEGLTGKADAAVATGNREAGGALLLEGGNQGLAVHVDGFRRHSGDMRVPRALDCTRGGVTTTRSRICNSASDTEGGAVGGTAFFDQGYLGAAVSTHRSDYGTVAEDEVTIGMRADRYALEGEWRRPGAALESVKGQLSHTDYRHTEFDAGAPGTLFTSQGNDLRLQARHRPLGRLQGVIGLQTDRGRFAAEGAEAFVPASRTDQQALFVHEELERDWGRLTLGARTESVQVESLGGNAPTLSRFVVGERRFHPRSLALGGLARLNPTWQFTANLAATQRAPRDYELFADGPHVATAAWERGDASLGLERATSLDAGLAWKSGPHRAGVNGYLSRFGNYLSLQPTGGSVTQGGETLPEHVYRGVRARFVGLEASGSLRLAGADGVLGDSAQGLWDLEWRGDLTRATDRDTGTPLPRIPPRRIGATVVWVQGAWGARVGVDHVAEQRRVPVGSQPTDAYSLWHAAASYRHKAGRTQLNWYARLDNLTDRLAYSATSVLTSTAFPKAPLPGRSLKIGVQAAF